jgi:hypothetical protein
MLCGWRCGARLTRFGLRAHFMALRNQSAALQGGKFVLVMFWAAAMLKKHLTAAPSNRPLLGM